MMQNDIAYAMIRNAVEKGIDDIQESPERGIHKLLDLGEMFAGGRFQKDFFSTAQSELQNDTSIYYRLVEKVVTGTDPAVLTSFGMNLGYNSWTLGAGMIRELEDKNGFNIPWCILFDMGYGQYMSLSTIADTIRQGKELGIYSYLLYIDAEYPDLDELMDLLGEEPDCAFFLFIHPSMVTPILAGRLLTIKTIWTNIDLDVVDPEQVRRSAEILLQYRCLCGAFARYSDWERQVAPCLSLAGDLGFPFLTLVSAKKCHPGIRNGEGDLLIKLRRNLSQPVFPIGLFSDMARIDRNISTEACLTAILGNGSVLITDAENMKTRYNINDKPLKSILAESMPKKRNTTPV